jgi:hypothetical protein
MVTVNELRDALARSPVLGLDINGPTAPTPADVLALLVCDDPDCLEACAPGEQTDCSDAEDEDLDGLVDCADPDCWDESVSL